MKTIAPILVFGFLLLLCTSCSRGFEPIEYGQDACAHCRMTIVDARFATELVDDKGKVFKFDDLLCMKQFIDENQKTRDNLLFVEDYLKKTEGPLDATKAIYLRHPFFASPMNGNYAAFDSEQDAQSLKDSLGIEVVRWEEIK